MSRTLRVMGKCTVAKSLALLNPEILSEQFSVAGTKWDGCMKVVDIYARDEAYLKFIEESILEAIKNNEEFAADTEEERVRLARKHIREKQLWAMCPYKECLDRINEAFGNEIPEEHLFLYADSSYNKLRNISDLEYLANYYESPTGKGYSDCFEDINKFMKSTFNHDTYKMGFDLVVGCVPCVDDTCGDYMKQAKRLAGKMAVLTVSNYWLRRRGIRFEFEANSFNKKVLPYISDIIYYDDSKMALGEDVLGGLSGVVINNYPLSNVNVYYANDKLAIENDIEGPKMRGRIFNKAGLNDLDPVVYAVAKRVDLKGLNKLEVCKHKDTGKYRVAVKDSCGKDCYYDKDGKLKGVYNYIVLEPNMECPKLYREMFTVESGDEAESLISYLRTSVIRYILAKTMASEKVGAKKNWGMIPAPTSLDKKWTNARVCGMLGLKKYMSLIEQTMKEV